VKGGEQRIAEIVVAYLEALGADVYQEVTVSGGVADIVARVGAELWIVEVKTSLSLALVAQAMERRRLAHRVFIAAPYTRNLRDVACLCEEIGVGVFEVRAGDLQSPYEWDAPKVYERVNSRRWNTRPVALTARLQPEHKTHAKAGAVGAGGRWTPFRNTCEQLARIVREQPGITVKAAIDSIKHHYASAASARSSLADWAEKGKIKGVRLDRSDVLRLYPIEATR
jgi:hypothetical protein